jgi:hypothetical protein
MKPSIVDIKAAIEARRSAIERVEDQRADEGSRVIALLVKKVGKVREPRGKRDSEIIHVVELWVGAGEDGSVRRRGQRDMRKGVREHDALEGDGVQIRGESALRAEKPHAIGTGCVESNKDDVGTLNGRGEAEGPDQEK